MIGYHLQDRHDSTNGLRAARHMRNLARDYGEERFESACAYAWPLNITALRSMNSILANQADLRAARPAPHPIAAAAPQCARRSLFRRIDMSTNTQNTSQMRELRLTAMAEAYELQQEQPKLHQLAFDDRVGLLLEAETAARKSRKLNRLVRVASLPETAAFEDLDTRASRGLDKALLFVAGQLQLDCAKAEPDDPGAYWRRQDLAGQRIRAAGLSTWHNGGVSSGQRSVRRDLGVRA